VIGEHWLTQRRSLSPCGVSSHYVLVLRDLLWDAGFGPHILGVQRNIPATDGGWPPYPHSSSQRTYVFFTVS
jgi:hypothetical protein